jgi:hypothetical protein
MKIEFLIKILISLLQLAQSKHYYNLAFNFREVAVFANDTTIRFLTTYSFILQRNLDNNLNMTAWNTTLVPAQSNITIQFPQ